MTPCLRAQTLVDLENATWTHPTGPSTGWNSSQLTGYTDLSDGNRVTMTVSFAGTGTPTAGNLTILNESFFTGFAFQMDPATNTNGASFLNYERIDLEFDQAVQFDDFRITDVDRAGWDDVLFAEGWNGSGGVGALGSGTTANYSFNTTTNLGTEILYGHEMVVVTTGGNTVNGPESDLFIDFGGSLVDAVSLYYWNGDYAATDTTQTIGLTATTGEQGFFVTTPAPEPSTAIFLLVGFAALLFYRPLRATQAA
ncbi:MAG: hypothetical protein HKN23_11000 [Verrucomicrobiales bacterium]|nr:hypothetical protein [Verrucomicrobiales bacterium]